MTGAGVSFLTNYREELGGIKRKVIFNGTRARFTTFFF